METMLGPRMKGFSEKFYFWLFAGICCVLLGFGFHYLLKDEVSTAVTLFFLALAFSVFGNLSRFKRFKGFGFEMEVWNDVQEKADSLVKKHERVTILHAKEILWNTVMMGRWPSKDRWRGIYRKFDEIVKEVGSPIEFSELRQNMDRMCINDIVHDIATVFGRYLNLNHTKASDFINQRHPSPVVDNVGFGNLHRILSETHSLTLGDPLTQNTGEVFLGEIRRIELIFQETFDIDNRFGTSAVSILEEASRLYNASPNDPSELLALQAKAVILNETLYK